MADTQLDLHSQGDQSPVNHKNLYIKCPLGLDQYITARWRAHHFFRNTSRVTFCSSNDSANSFLRRTFSVSSAFNRLASDTSIPELAAPKIIARLREAMPSAQVFHRHFCVCFAKKKFDDLFFRISFLHVQSPHSSATQDGGRRRIINISAADLAVTFSTQCSSSLSCSWI